MNINPKDQICGTPILKVRDLLRRTRGDPVDVELASYILKLSTEAAYPLLHCLVANGLMRVEKGLRDETLYAPTVKGNALALASAARMLHRATALRILDECVIRLHALNHQGFVLRLSWAVAFGSVLTDAPRVSDVDVAVMLVRVEGNGESFLAAGQERVRIAIENGRVFASWADEMYWPETEPLLFLKAGRGYLSLHDASHDNVVLRLIAAGKYRLLAGDDSLVQADATHLLEAGIAKVMK